jgi:hypothetical protein
MFGKTHEALRGRRFASDDEVKDALRTWFQSQPQLFIRRDHKACEPLQKKNVLGKGGEYVQK